VERAVCFRVRDHRCRKLAMIERVPVRSGDPFERARHRRRLKDFARPWGAPLRHEMLPEPEIVRKRVDCQCPFGCDDR